MKKYLVRIIGATAFVLICAVVVNIVVNSNSSNKNSENVSATTQGAEDTTIDSLLTVEQTEPETEEPTDPPTEKKEVTSSYIIEGIEHLTQYNYPAGCESVSTTMLLNYLGFNISIDEFIDNYLPMQDLIVGSDGNLTGPDPASMFIGSPYSTSGLGCYPPVIEYACNNYFKVEDSEKIAIDTTGATIDELIENYIIYDIPVLVWPTMYMAESFETTQWIIKDKKVYSDYSNGDLFAWRANEHCLVLVGYDENYYYCNDPLYDYEVQFDKALFEQRYEEMGNMSLVII